MTCRPGRVDTEDSVGGQGDKVDGQRARVWGGGLSLDLCLADSAVARNDAQAISFTNLHNSDKQPTKRSD